MQVFATANAHVLIKYNLLTLKNRSNWWCVNSLSIPSSANHTK